MVVERYEGQRAMQAGNGTYKDLKLEFLELTWLKMEIILPPVSDLAEAMIYWKDNIKIHIMCCLNSF